MADRLLRRQTGSGSGSGTYTHWGGPVQFGPRADADVPYDWERTRARERERERERVGTGWNPFRSSGVGRQQTSTSQGAGSSGGRRTDSSPSSNLGAMRRSTGYATSNVR